MRVRRAGMSVLVLCAAVATVASAQKSTNYGVLAGGSFAKFRGSDVGEFSKTKVGIAAGLFVTAGLTPQFAIEPEFLYVMKGGKNDSDESIKISYIEIPVLLKLRVPTKGIVSPNFYVGPQLGIKAGCSVKSAATNDCGTAGVTLKSTEFGVVFGAGVDVRRAIITARYDLGLTKLDSQPPTEDVKNGTFYLLAGWAFRTPH